MKGYTSWLTLILLILFTERVTSQKPDTAPDDVLPQEPARILLPTKAGTIDFAKVGGEFGVFAEKYSTCGKHTVNGQDLGITFTDAFEIQLHCFPHPMRVLIPKDAQKAPLTIDQTKRGGDPKTCQGLQTCEDPPDLKEINHGAETNRVLKDADAKNVLQNDVNICTNNAGFVFTNEVGCEKPEKIVDSDIQITSEYYIAPRWKTNEKGLFEMIRPFTYSGLGKVDRSTFDRTNNFVKLPKPTQLITHNWHECSASCDIGSIVKMNMKPGAWSAIIYLKGKTEGFKVCISAEDHTNDKTTPKCRKAFELFILPRNGLVIWPKSGRASMIELKSSDIGEDGNYAIELGYGFGKTNDGQLAGEFYVANMYREMVVSDSNGWSMGEASKLSFFFSSEDSLVPTAGIYSENIETAKTYVDDANAKEVKNNKIVAKAGDLVADGKESLTSPQEELTLPLVPTTTPAPKRLGSNAAEGVLLQSTDNSNDAIYMPGKWWAWGLYIGFIIGSIVGVAIIGGIFYVLRRTVYGFWYRGMYKRYGCDASGTTGGITGVGFGNTTTGAITVGGTTGGGTTAGTTGGTTTGSNTRTGGTTGSMTSTGGASTIAM